MTTHSDSPAPRTLAAGLAGLWQRLCRVLIVFWAIFLAVFFLVESETPAGLWNDASFERELRMPREWHRTGGVLSRYNPPICGFTPCLTRADEYDFLLLVADRGFGAFPATEEDLRAARRAVRYAHISSIKARAFLIAGAIWPVILYFVPVVFRRVIAPAGRWLLHGRANA